MEKFSIEIKDDQFLIRLKREGYDLPSLYRIVFNLQKGLFNVNPECFNETEGDIRSRINDHDDENVDYLGDK